PPHYWHLYSFPTRRSSDLGSAAAYSGPSGSWSGDTHYTGGARHTYGARPIGGTNDPALYTSVHYGRSFTYRLPAPAGAYTLRLQDRKSTRLNSSHVKTSYA